MMMVMMTMMMMMMTMTMTMTMTMFSDGDYDDVDNKSGNNFCINFPGCYHLRGDGTKPQQTDSTFIRC